jgi:hypothetical protein
LAMSPKKGRPSKGLPPDGPVGPLTTDHGKAMNDGYCRGHRV